MDNSQKLVLKLGSSSLVKDGKINKKMLAELARELASLKENGVNICLVTSGAIALGVGRLALETKPNEIDKKQACAAIGQSLLMRQYESIFDIYGLKCAQLLLTHQDFDRADSRTHLYNTVNALWSYGVIPIINENDATSVDEIKVGDNDTLGALTSILIKAHSYVIVSDVEGLYTANPSTASAVLISDVEAVTPQIKALAVGCGNLGTGGMTTKINAAETVNAKGIDMYIIHNSKIEYLSDILNGERIGTKFHAVKG